MKRKECNMLKYNKLHKTVISIITLWVFLFNSIAWAETSIQSYHLRPANLKTAPDDFNKIQEEINKKGYPALAEFAQTDEWTYKVTQYNPQVEKYLEALFGLGNGKISTRSAAEERGNTNISQPMTFIAGVFNKVGDEVPELVNIPNWLPIKFRTIVDEEYGKWFSATEGEILDYSMSLDMKNGVLERKVKWKDDKGRVVNIQIRRFISRADKDIAAIEYKIIPEFSGQIEFESGLDGSVTNSGRKHLKAINKGEFGKNSIYLTTQTKQTGLYITEASKIKVFKDNKEEIAIVPNIIAEADKIYQNFTVDAVKDKELRLEKIVSIISSKDIEDVKAFDKDYIEQKAKASVRKARKFNRLYEKHKKAWADLWETSKIIIKGDSSIQKTLNYSIFSTLQSAHKDIDYASPGARLLGKGYKGHVFWDNEIYLLPTYIYTQPEIAKSLLMYRYYGLSGAEKRAKLAGFKGAQFPWESGQVGLIKENGEIKLVGGEEITSETVINEKGERVEILTGKFEEHINWDIAAAIKKYYDVTGDKEFMKNYGMEMVLKIAQFAASRVKWNEEKGWYETRAIGPNEYAEYDLDGNPGVLNNAYNNVMIAVTIHTALELLNEMGLDDQKVLLKKIGLTKDEYKNFEKSGKEIINKIRIPYDYKKKLILESENFLKREKLDLLEFKDPDRLGHIFKEMDVAIEKKYGEKAYNYQIIKQPDVMMLFALSEIFSPKFKAVMSKRFGRDIFNKEHLFANQKFYSPITSGGSTLSFGMMSLCQSKNGDIERAYEYFKESMIVATGGTKAAVNKISNDGLPTANMGGIYNSVIRGFAGLEIFSDGIKINPRLPKAIDSISFKIKYKGAIIEITVSNEQVKIISENKIKVKIGNKDRFSIAEVESIYDLQEDNRINNIAEQVPIAGGSVLTSNSKEVDSDV